MARLIYVLFSFEGRLRRRDFWLFGFVVLPVISVLLSVVGSGLDLAFNTQPIQGLSFFVGLYPISLILSNLTLFPMLSVIVKRLHDRNKSARRLLLLIIPMLGAVWILIEAGFLPGNKGPNDWGDDPRQPMADSPIDTPATS